MKTQSGMMLFGGTTLSHRRRRNSQRRILLIWWKIQYNQKLKVSVFNAIFNSTLGVQYQIMVASHFRK